MGQQWITALGVYNFSLHYIKGKENVVANALSHIPTQPELEVVIDKDGVKELLSINNTKAKNSGVATGI